MSQGEKDSPNTSSYEVWADSMEKEYDAKAGQQPSRTEPYTIHRVPDSIRIVDEGAYEPKMLSIGPYHRLNPKLKAMEDRKWHCLRGILHRYPERRLSDYLKEMEGLEVQVRGFYSENEEIKRIGSKEFVEMMLLDGCFILELLPNPAGDVNDPIYGTKWIWPIIRLDMLLLENQLPFLVLRHLSQFVKGSNNSSLVELAVQLFKHVMPLKREVAQVDSFHHLLDLFHWHLLPETSPHSLITMESPSSIPSATENQSASPNSSITAENVPEQSRSPPSIPSATEIEYIGPQLRSKEGASSILDVEFIRMGVLEIPLLCINHSTNSIFRNLIAWEQCYPASGNYFTSYAIFMDCLIDTPEDVVVLKRRKIIEHWLGNNEQVALLFNKMCMGITTNFEGSFLSDLSDQVKQFQNSRRNLWRGRLIRDYFRDPWAIINLQFTVTIIIFTLVQTTLAVLSYKRPS
eukprot:TRINITY_DN15249_c1_g1_i1.p1 TRINITY_DN15249_c1_g1~~TRINITY_DN15249_c1_g1_i1.p1  ORF type:complete len:461 (+),score=35.63 TRINITY_DN15249_c1_g1_i1:148-1530(+)